MVKAGTYPVPPTRSRVNQREKYASELARAAWHDGTLRLAIANMTQHSFKVWIVYADGTLMSATKHAARATGYTFIQKTHRLVIRGHGTSLYHELRLALERNIPCEVRVQLLETL